MSGSSKLSFSKPLKGEQIISNYGSFDVITANSVVLETVNIAGVYEDGVFLNVDIKDSNISNTIIGSDGAAPAYFSYLQTSNDVLFQSDTLNEDYMKWDSATGVLTLSNDLVVEGCSYLGNLEICENYIRAVNTNGDINLIPNNTGTVYVRGGIYHVTTSGNFYSEVRSGGAAFVVNNNISLYSSTGTARVTSFDNQTYSTVNGDITLKTESITSKSIKNILNTNGNVMVTTNFVHDLKVGDTITITGANTLSNNYMVGSVVSNTSFLLASISTLIPSTITTGSLLKSVSNKIVLDTSNMVTMPENTRMVFGVTSNNMMGNTTGLMINSINDIVYSVGSLGSIKVPQETKMQYGTSGNNYINFVGGTTSSLNVVAANQVMLSGSRAQINTTNVRFYDPILTLGDYTLSNVESKDRGIEYRYYDVSSGSMKLGWFGYKSSTNKFTFMVDAVNTDELITGTVGNFEMGQVSTTQLEISNGGNLNMNCGNILSVNTINGCSGVINVSAGTRISLVTANVVIPNNVPLTFGSSGSRLIEGTNGSLVMIGASSINLSVGSTIVPVGSYVSFSGSSVGEQRISGNSSGDLLINASSNVYIIPTGGNVIIPSNTNIQMGVSSQVIYGNTSGVVILTSNTGSSLNLLSNGRVNVGSSLGNVELNASVGDIYLYASVGNVRLLSNEYLVFSNSGTSNSILSSFGGLVINGSSVGNISLRNVKDIDLLASSRINIPVGVFLTYSSDGSRYMVSDTSGNLRINSISTVISSTGGQLLINNNVTSITSGVFSVNGLVTNLNTQDVKLVDPIVTLANYDVLVSDGKDRGVEYKYYDVSTGSMKLGWFGWKGSSNRFTYYSDAVNVGEVISGTLGQLEVSGVVISDNLTFRNAGRLDMSCGTIANVSTIVGCGGVLNVIGGTNINITSSNINVTSSNMNLNSSNILLNAGSRVQVPYNVPFILGTSSSTSISGDTLGNMRIAAPNNLIIDANVQINGTTMNVYSTVTNIEDPIFSLGGVSGPIINDNKDRGIEFKWGNNASTKTGFFGYKNDLGRFVYIRDGVNNNEIFSGVYGDVQFGNGFFNNLDVNNGTISNVKLITGNDIYISSGSVTIPYNSRLSFGSTSSSISGDTNGDIVIYTTMGGIYLMTNTMGSGFIDIGKNVPLNIGDTRIIQNMSGDMQVINTSGNIELTPKDTVTIPVNKYLNFGGSTVNSIIGDGTNLIMNGYNGINMNSSTVTISGSVNITGTLSTSNTDFDLNKYILPLGTFQALLVTDISNYVGSVNGNVRITTNSVHYLTVGDKVTLSNTNSNPVVDGIYDVVEVIDGTKFLINKVGGLVLGGNMGNFKSNLKVDPGKDVGIGVNYWKDLVGNNIVTGSVNYHTGFFGWKNDTRRWSFYSDAVINNDVIQSGGTFGNIEVNKVFTTKMSGFELEGNVNTGSYIVNGSNFQINGGSINTTPVGNVSPQTGRFTSLSNTVTALLRDVTMETSLCFNIDRYTITSSMSYPNPSINNVLTVFSVVGVNYTSSMSTMQSNPSIVKDGMYKMIVCGAMGVGCQHTIYFGEDRIICPSPLTGPKPTRLVFKRAGQSCSLVYDQVLGAWILLNSGAYVY
jgi:hypothetical protein